MPAGAGLSLHPVSALATGEMLGQVIEAGFLHPCLAVLAVGPGHAGALDDIASTVAQVLGPGVLLGGVVAAVGITTLVREGPMMGLWVCHGPDVGEVRPSPWGPGDRGPAGAGRGSLQMMFGDRAPSLDGAPSPGGGGLFGAVVGRPVTGFATTVTQAQGAAQVMPGPALRVVGLRGLRPLGPRLVAHGGGGRLLERLDGVPALDRLETIARDGVPAGRLRHLGEGLHLHVGPGSGPPGPGRAAPGSPVGSPAEVLAVLGTLRRERALAVDRPVRPGASVQFLLADPAAATAALTAARGNATSALILAAKGHGSALLDALAGPEPGPGTGHGAGAGSLCLESVAPFWSAGPTFGPAGGGSFAEPGSQGSVAVLVGSRLPVRR